MEAFVSVYVDMAATADSVRAAVAELPKPKGVFDVTVDCNSVTDTFGLPHSSRPDGHVR
jgi:transposase